MLQSSAKDPFTAPNTSSKTSTGAVNAKSAPNPKKSFLDLPGEIRNQIYVGSLIHGKSSDMLEPPHKGSTNVLRLNRQIFGECNHIFCPRTQIFRVTWDIQKYGKVDKKTSQGCKEISLREMQRLSKVVLRLRFPHAEKLGGPTWWNDARRLDPHHIHDLVQALRNNKYLTPLCLRICEPVLPA